MPIYKYRHVGQMDECRWYEPGDPRLFRAIRGTWEFARRATHPRFPPGVYKHRSATAADRLREAWEEESFRAFRACRDSS